MGHVASLIRFHTNSLKPFKRTIKQTTESMPPPSPQPITASAMTTKLIELQGYQSCYSIPKGLRQVQGLRVCDEGLLGFMVIDNLVVWN